MKPFLSDKIYSNETIVKDKEIIKNDQKNAKVWKNFFSDIIKNLDIPQYNQADLVFHSIKDPVIKAIFKYRNHPTVIALKEECTNLKFSFSFMKKWYFKRNLKSSSK